MEKNQTTEYIVSVLHDGHGNVLNVIVGNQTSNKLLLQDGDDLVDATLAMEMDLHHEARHDD